MGLSFSVSDSMCVLFYSAYECGICIVCLENSTVLSVPCGKVMGSLILQQKRGVSLSLAAIGRGPLAVDTDAHY